MFFKYLKWVPFGTVKVILPANEIDQDLAPNYCAKFRQNPFKRLAAAVVIHTQTKCCFISSQEDIARFTR